MRSPANGFVKLPPNTAGVIPLAGGMLRDPGTDQPRPLCRHQGHNLVTVVLLMVWTPGLPHTETFAFCKPTDSCQAVKAIGCCQLNQLSVCKYIFWDADCVFERDSSERQKVGRGPRRGPFREPSFYTG